MAYSLAVNAQNLPKIVTWGKVDKEDLEMKECDFDKNAEAVVLYDGGDFVEYTNQPMELRKHIRIKILSEKGLDRANIKLNFIKYNKEESIRDIEAQTYNLDASGNVVVTEVESSLIYEKRVSGRMSQKAFAFPQVKVGSVIEYRYTRMGVTMGNWYFQRSIPVRYSFYRTDVPEQFEIASRPVVTLPCYITSDSIRGRKLQSFIMQNIPALRDEPFISCEDDYLERVESRVIGYRDGKLHFIYSTKWEDIVIRLMQSEDFGKQLGVELKRAPDLEEKISSEASLYGKMEKSYITTCGHI